MSQLQLCSFEQSKALKEAGFDWDANNYYELDTRIPKEKRIQRVQVVPMNYNETDHSLSCPSVQLALKWLREEKGIYGSISFGGTDQYGTEMWTITVTHKGLTTTFFNTDYSNAESACLDECLKILKEQKA